MRLLSDDPNIEVLGAAATASGGLERARADPPDVVLMDFGLPDMTGAVATRLLKTMCPDTKVITLTGSEHLGAYNEAVEAGSVAWVRKTRAVHDLVIAVHQSMVAKYCSPTSYRICRHQSNWSSSTSRLSSSPAMWSRASRPWSVGSIQSVDCCPRAISFPGLKKRASSMRSDGPWVPGLARSSSSGRDRSSRSGLVGQRQCVWERGQAPNPYSRDCIRYRNERHPPRGSRSRGHRKHLVG